MTDMRATERLLEVIEENGRVLDMARGDEPFNHDMVTNILLAVIELRRRGDTLVRAADLRLIVEEAQGDRAQIMQEFSLSSDPTTDKDRAWAASIDRLENAIGGKMR